MSMSMSMSMHAGVNMWERNSERTSDLLVREILVPWFFDVRLRADHRQKKKTNRLQETII